ncbi:MAG TPA: hypothetical protein VI229_00200 [Burkholderiales bacterium]
MNSADELLEHLRMCAQFQPNGFYAFVLKHGRLWTPAPRPAGMRKQRNGTCFKSAYEAAERDSALTYVEGYGMSVIPVLHAWCVDQEGRVVDPVWTNPETRAYYGIPLTLEFLHRTMMRTRVYGVLDDPETVGLMAKADPSTFLANTGVPA